MSKSTNNIIDSACPPFSLTRKHDRLHERRYVVPSIPSFQRVEVPQRQEVGPLGPQAAISNVSDLHMSRRRAPLGQASSQQ